MSALVLPRIKHWRKYKGAHSEGAGAAVGQAAAILRKANERRQVALAAGRGGLGPRGVIGSGGRGQPVLGRGLPTPSQRMPPPAQGPGGYYGPR
jgi:hypothetical protein